MVKRLRATGRKRAFTKRVIGRRFPSKRVAMQKSSTTTLVSRTLYPELPAIFKVALSVSSNRKELVPAAEGGALRGTTLIAPLGFNLTQPQGLDTLMKIYSRGVIDRVQVAITFTPFRNQAGAIPGVSNMQPIQLATGILPRADFQAIPGTANGFNQFASYPGTKVSLLGSLFAQSPVTHFHSLDIGRFTNGRNRLPLYSISSTQAGVIDFPPLEPIPDAPMFAFWITSLGENPGAFIVRSITYHMTFSSKHLASTDAQA